MLSAYRVAKPIRELLHQELTGGTTVTTLEPDKVLPEWCVCIAQQLRKTVFKRVIELDPKQTVDWYKYGKLIGVMDRFESWVAFDVPEVIKREGLDQLTPAQESKVESVFNDAESRREIGKRLGRKIKAHESSDALADELEGKQAAAFKNIIQNAERLAAGQKPKNRAKFLQGRAEGFKLFLDEDGGFAGDRGRSNLYIELLALREEIEKLAAVKPRMTRPELHKWLLTEGQVKMSNNPEWFDHFCDEIQLFKLR